MDSCDFLDKTLTLPNGRVLGWRESGKLDGRPVFHFHGYPSSRVESGLGATIAANAGVRLISIDRPGYGLSSYVPERKLLDWPADVAAVADHLKLERFSIVGVSGGGPYALATALLLPERITATALICPLGCICDADTLNLMRRRTRFFLKLGRDYPRFTATTLRHGAVTVTHTCLAPMFAVFRHTLPWPDSTLLADTQIRDIMVGSFKEGFRTGGHGPAQDLGLYTRSWGFQPEDIPNDILILHGTRDAVVPCALSESLARRLPRAQLRLIKDEGHYSLAVNRMREALDVIAPAMAQ